MDTLNNRINRWERRGVYDDPRLTELVTLYKDSGFTVKLEAFNPDPGSTCNECIRDNPDQYKVLYTKKIVNKRIKVRGACKK